MTYIVSSPEGKADALSLSDEKRYKKAYIDKTVLQEAIQQSKKGKLG